ncbi:MAG TPA: Hpt domain-containing protein [Candidatus Nitrosotalea sp.]|nr:Hpt domain-containing protein [Candidatus Nitrosotalea sp.]
MSDEFLRVARQEIQEELNEIEQIMALCNNDERLFAKSQSIEEHLHKIKGLAPMIGHGEIGEIAKISYDILKHIINEGVLPGSYFFMLEIVDDMKKILLGFDTYDITKFKKLTREKFPAVSDL